MPTIDKSQVPRVAVFVWHRPKGPQGEAKLAARKRMTLSGHLIDTP